MPPTSVYPPGPILSGSVAFNYDQYPTVFENIISFVDCSLLLKARFVSKAVRDKVDRLCLERLRGVVVWTEDKGKLRARSRGGLYAGLTLTVGQSTKRNLAKRRPNGPPRVVRERFAAVKVIDVHLLSHRDHDEALKFLIKMFHDLSAIVVAPASVCSNARDEWKRKPTTTIVEWDCGLQKFQTCELPEAGERTVINVSASVMGGHMCPGFPASGWLRGEQGQLVFNFSRWATKMPVNTWLVTFMMILNDLLDSPRLKINIVLVDSHRPFKNARLGPGLDCEANDATPTTLPSNMIRWLDGRRQSTEPVSGDQDALWDWADNLKLMSLETYLETLTPEQRMWEGY